MVRRSRCVWPTGRAILARSRSSRRRPACPDRAGRAAAGPRLRFLVPGRAGPRRQDAARQSGRAGGLREGDEILAVNGVPVADFAALVAAVQPKPGTRLEFTIKRDGGRSACRSRSRRSARASDSSVVSACSRGTGRASRRHADPRTPWPARRTGPRDRQDLEHVRAHGAHALERRHRRRLGQEPERPINIAEYAGFSARQGILAFCHSWPS